MENKMMYTEEILFENKGMPTKMRNFLIIFGVSLLIIGISGLVFVLLQPDYTGYQSSEPQMIDGKAVFSITAPSGIRAEERTLYIKVFSVAFVVGALVYSISRGGKKFYFQIFENHIMGCSGFWFLTKNFNIPIKQIAELSTNEEGWMPVVLIRTIHGNNIPIFMNKDKVIDAENILRNLIKNN